MAKRKEAFKQGKTLGISGRELFLFNPELVGGDEEDDLEGGDVMGVISREDQGEEDEGVDVTDMLAMAAASSEGVRSEGEASGGEAGKAQLTIPQVALA